MKILHVMTLVKYYSDCKYNSGSFKSNCFFILCAKGKLIVGIRRPVQNKREMAFQNNLDWDTLPYPAIRRIAQ